MIYNSGCFKDNHRWVLVLESTGYSYLYITFKSDKAAYAVMETYDAVVLLKIKERRVLLRMLNTFDLSMTLNDFCYEISEMDLDSFFFWCEDDERSEILYYFASEFEHFNELVKALNKDSMLKPTRKDIL